MYLACGRMFPVGKHRGNCSLCPDHFGVFYHDGVLSRFCRKCYQVSSVELFSKDKSDPTGLVPVCSGCFKKKNLKLKMAAIGAYGGVCVCCGEKDHRFLTIDHVEQDGAEHRRSINNSGGHNMYYWLKNNDYPDGFQVLCFNCNCGRSINGGVCPHQEGSVDGITS